MKFTDRGVAALKPGTERRTIYEDNAHGLGSLGLRISPAGSKVWVYSYSFEGRVRHMTLGRYPIMGVADAHAAFGAATLLREQGQDPGSRLVQQRADARTAPTVAELVEMYLELYARPKKKSAERDEAILRREVIPLWGPEKAESITRRDAVTLLDRMVARGAPIAANRALEVIRKMYNWALGRDMVPHNPCHRIPRPAQDNQRDRVLSESELRRFCERLPDAPMELNCKLALMFQLLTAQRSGEVAQAEWAEFAVDPGWWVIPAEKAKNGKIHRVPVSTQAAAVLEQAAVLSQGGRYVFRSFRRRNGGGDAKDAPMVATASSRAVRKSLVHLGMEAFTPHDLRRTAATEMTRLKVPQLVVERILSHKPRRVIGVYDRYGYDDEKQAALSSWGDRLEGLGLVAAVMACAPVIEVRVERRWRRGAVDG